QPDQERAAAIVDQLPQIVAMLQMAELVREDAGDLVGIVGLVEQASEEEEPPSRQREGVRNRRVQHLRCNGIVEAGRHAQRRDELAERRLSAGFAAELVT